jgi:hypothetical protein
VVYEGIALLIICWTSFDRPRKTKAGALKALYDDGVIYVVVSISPREEKWGTHGVTSSDPLWCEPTGMVSAVILTKT